MGSTVNSEDGTSYIFLTGILSEPLIPTLFSSFYLYQGSGSCEYLTKMMETLQIDQPVRMASEHVTVEGIDVLSALGSLKDLIDNTVQYAHQSEAGLVDGVDVTAPQSCWELLGTLHAARHTSRDSKAVAMLEELSSRISKIMVACE